MTTGSGTLSPIPLSPGGGSSDAWVLAEGVYLGMSLDRYQELTHLPIAAFNSLNRPEELPMYECSTIWKNTERQRLALALAQAEEMREQELGYHLAPKYDYLDELVYANPIILPKKHVIKLGIRTIADVQLALPIDLGLEDAPNDPVLISMATTLTDPDEIFLFYAGESEQINPSRLTISSGVLTIQIPRSRLVKTVLKYQDREDPLSYYENDNFIEAIDIKRVYYDQTQLMEYVWLGSCDSTDLSTPYVQAAYARIKNSRLGVIVHQPASYASGVWGKASWTRCVEPTSVRLGVLSGIRASTNIEMLTIHLANTLMPNKPCSCPTVSQVWEEDMIETRTFTPYGNRYGAVNAWIADSRAKVGHGGKFPSIHTS